MHDFKVFLKLNKMSVSWEETSLNIVVILRYFFSSSHNSD